ncbi:Sqs1p [Kluyveromyces lactis]|uniref:Protein SQS1 n=1 Tax=Kluyveromyces lactis (strain ATCC 8585 / CBS 2359 / DSM 70799 / NBRC 1267 / NRRL Y-1140 / WM37) TaxID=284590 RepID=SQS1_KLULA|nr:uncharacterized protein KLLA0_D19558g [Kluyveromyces lactis]Q6CQ59.1 RecName: Full=Protein SQS1 [Kluyveromyces lactis NRRL Y-1140]CAH01026.1 KLLA0D19558p [Kluyveromyces lactis]|eukprot:XP_453930.1 uncharacterized protein KLLA0_D19558g [Kluyveromyces lactis]
MAKRHKHYNARGGGKSKSKKSKPHGESRQRKNHRGGTSINRNRSELLLGGGDLMNPHQVEDYYFGSTAKKSSLRSGGFRPGRLTEADELDTGRLPSRKRPVEFIKAKELYDPSHDLILKLVKKNQHFDEPNSDGYNSSQSVSLREEEQDGEDEQQDVDTQEIPSKNTTVKIRSDNVVSENGDSESNSSANDAELFYVDMEGEEKTADNYIKTVDVDVQERSLKLNDCTEFQPTLRVGNVELNLKDGGSGSIEVDKPKSSYHPFHSYIQNVMENVQNYDSDDDFDENGNDVEQSFSISSDYEFESSEELITTGGTIEQFDSSMKSLTIEEIPGKTITASLTTKDISQGNSDNSSGDESFGFCEDDFEGSIGKVFVSNIRIGAGTHSYHVSCHEIYGDSEPRWVDDEMMNEIIAEMGLPEHRFRAYYKHLHKSFIEEEEEPEEYADIPFDDDDSDDSTADQCEPFAEDDLGEDLDDLVSYALKYNKQRKIEYHTTSLDIRGKGRNKHLIFDQTAGMDEDIKLMLQNKFATRQINKTKKRRAKEDFLSQSHASSTDLLMKYPYGLHIQNIKDEFDAFYRNDRQSITFPPLDPHGNKIIGKFAYNYFMKASNIGKGKSTKVYVEKTKKTRFNKPAYHIISQLLRKRPVFMRIDQKAPTDTQSTFNRTVRLKVSKENFNISEGQIVGEDAPEIGIDNIGRRMLEKLGWNIGQGLGAHGNQGINEPILAKVKKNKSGLRHTSENQQ